MKIMLVRLVLLLFLLVFRLLTATPAYAHEAYVLSPEQFQVGLATYTPDPLGSFLVFFSKDYLAVSAVVLAVSVVAYGINFVIAESAFGKREDRFIKRARNWGLLVVRLTLAASFLYGASGGNVFGPELQLSHIAFGQWILPLKFILGMMFLLGIFTELAAALGILIYFLVLVSIGQYVLTYLNYLGELVALVLFGSRFLSVDGWVFKEEMLVPAIEKLKKWEVPIVRIGLGLALIYTAINVKFLHQMLPIEVVNQYHLERYFFNWSAQYIAIGAGMVELMIGTFVLLGFAQRLTVLVFMAFITLSLLYFREAVWPHLLLYGISILLFIDDADFLTVDHYLIPFLRRVIKNMRGKYDG